MLILTYEFDPRSVSLSMPALLQRVRPGCFEGRGMEVLAASRRRLVLRPPAEVEWPQHWDVDAQPSKHQLYGAKHERRERRAREVADQVDDEDLPEADNADDHAPAFVSFSAISVGLLVTYAAPRAKQEMTASFSVFRICNFHTDLIGSTKMKRSVRMFVMISDLSTRI